MNQSRFDFVQLVFGNCSRLVRLFSSLSCVTVVTVRVTAQAIVM